MFLLIFGISIPFLSFNVWPYEVVVSNVTPQLEFSNPHPLTSQVEENIAIPIWTMIYIVGLTIGLGFLIINMIRFLISISTLKFTTEEDIKVSYGSNWPDSSFFNYVFLSNDDPVKKVHEFGHVTKKHSIDRVVVALLTCVFWFNPLVWLFRGKIIENHEFEADQYAMKKLNISKVEYGQYLVEVVQKSFYQMPQFNHYSQIKNRINMLKSSKSISGFAYAGIMLISIGIFSAFTFKSYPVYVSSDDLISTDTIPNSKDSIIVYDPKTNTEFVRETSVDGRGKGQLSGKYNSTIKSVDTIAMFDYDTYTETVRVVESNVNLEEYLDRISFSGKKQKWVDTIAVFNTETYTESTMVILTEVPFEFNSIMNQISDKDKNVLISDYGNTQTISASKGVGVIYLFKSDDIRTIKVLNDRGSVVKFVDLPAGSDKVVPESLGLNEGKYTLKDSYFNAECHFEI